MSKFVYFLIFLAVMLLVWVAWSYFVIRNVEQLKYQVLEQNENYEIRQYEPSLLAETVIEDVGYSEAFSEGFRRIAGYIFGGNKSQESIAMTAPVTEEGSEKIAMTVPVTEEKQSEKSRKVAFVMPSKYSMDTLPIPNDDRVKLREVPARKMAVLSFGWYPTADNVEAKKLELVDALRAKGVKYVGMPIYAGYNPPFSFPLFLKNEVMVELAQ